MNKSGIIFLSHSSSDKGYVEKVVELLPQSHIFYDTRTIQPGESNTSQIEDALDTTDVFALFLSPETMERDFVKLETKIIKTARIRRDYIKIIIIPIKGASYSDAPEWMREFQSTNENYNQGDIARLIWNSYISTMEKKGEIAEKIFVGRETLVTKMLLKYKNDLRKNATPPNFIHLVGFEQIGRTELAKNIVRKLFPGASQHPAEIELKANADAIDLFLALTDMIDGPQKREIIISKAQEFRKKDPNEHANIIFEYVKHYSLINQVVIIRSSMGLRDKRQSTKKWVENLLQNLEKDLKSKIIWISERKLPAATISNHKNLIEFEVPPLEDQAIEYLIERLTQELPYQSPDYKNLSMKLNGHPGTAYYVANLINDSNHSADQITQDESIIVSHQDKFISKSLDMFPTQSLEYAIIYWLTILPHCDYNSIKFLKENSAIEGDTNNALSILSESCIIKYAPNFGYSTPNIIKSSVRHKLTEHPQNLIRPLEKLIRNGIKNQKNKSNYLDMIIHILAFLGEKIPIDLNELITPASLQEIVNENYQNGLASATKEGVKFYETSIKYARIIIEIESSDDIKEDVLLTGAEASIRLGKEPHEFTDKMKAFGYQSVHLALGNHALYNTRDLRTAAYELRCAFDANVFKKRSGRLLCRVYNTQRRDQEALDVLEKLGKHAVEKDSGLLRSKIRALRGLNRIDEADSLEEKLDKLPDDFGDKELLIITSAIKTKKNLNEALIACERYKKKPKSNRLNAIFLEAILKIEMGKPEDSSEAILLAKNTGRDKDYYSLLTRKNKQEGKIDEALENYHLISSPNLYDKLIYLDICKKIEGNGENRNDAEFMIKEKEKILSSIRSENDDLF